METIKNIIGLNQKDSQIVTQSDQTDVQSEQSTDTVTEPSVESVEANVESTEVQPQTEPTESDRVHAYTFKLDPMKFVPPSHSKACDVESKRLFSGSYDQPMTQSETMDAYQKEMNKRDEQDMLWKAALSSDRQSLNRLYTSIISDNGTSESSSSLKTSMFRQVHSGDLNKQGKFIDVPIDFHKGPFMNPEDEYQIIFEGESEAKIRGNCNHQLIKTIGDTEVTHGMKAFAEGVKWNNGLICYNKNNIIVRNGDNNYGQPGFLAGVFFYDRLAVDIMNQYIVADLIAKANRNEFTIMTDAKEVRDFITKRYAEVRALCEERLNNSNMTETQLFADAPIREDLNAPLEESESRTLELEKRVRVLEEQVAFLMRRLEEVEDIALDSAIDRNENAINNQ